MKRCIGIIILCCAFSSLSAQYPQGIIVKFYNKHGWQAGAEAGPALTSIWGGNSPITTQINYSAGAFFRYNVFQWMAIQSGLNFERIGRSIDVNLSGIQGSGTAHVESRLDYITLPILCRFDAVNHRFNLNFTVGGFVSFLFNASEVSDLPGDSICPPQTFTATTEDFSRINAGIVGGIGLDYQFPRLKLGCELRNQLGLVHIRLYEPSGPFERTNSFQLLGRVSYRF